MRRTTFSRRRSWWSSALRRSVTPGGCAGRLRPQMATEASVSLDAACGDLGTKLVESSALVLGCRRDNVASLWHGTRHNCAWLWPSCVFDVWVPEAVASWSWRVVLAMRPWRTSISLQLLCSCMEVSTGPFGNERGLVSGARGASSHGGMLRTTGMSISQAFGMFWSCLALAPLVPRISGPFAMRSWRLCMRAIVCVGPSGFREERFVISAVPRAPKELPHVLIRAVGVALGMLPVAAPFSQMRSLGRPWWPSVAVWFRSSSLRLVRGAWRKTKRPDGCGIFLSWAPARATDVAAIRWPSLVLGMS